MTAGYSGTSLAKKLGLKPGMRAWFVDMPASVRAEIGDVGVVEQPAPSDGLETAHVFVARRIDLAAHLDCLRPLLAPTGQLWVSWPKKASKVPSEVTEDTVRELALPTGFVDVKVCAVDDVWSALKLVIRKELR